MSHPIQGRRQRIVAFVVKLGLLLFWVGGVYEAVRFCFLPWKGSPNGPEEFPFVEVGLSCGFITLQVLLLHVILRPHDLSCHMRRLWVALPVFIYFFILNYYSFRMGYDVQTDAPSLWLMNLDILTLVATIIAAVIFFGEHFSRARRSRTPTG